MGKPGVRKINRYGDKFKVTAVKLSDLPDVLIQDVAAALDIHPFMLSRWRREVREGDLVAKRVKVDVATAAELARLRELERKYAILKGEYELLKKAIRFASEPKTEVFEFIEANRERHRIAVMSRVYEVTRAGYYAWRKRGPSARTRSGCELAEMIERIHAASRSIYGSPRVTQVLRQSGR